MTFAAEINAGIDDQITEAGEALVVSRAGRSTAEIQGIWGTPRNDASQGDTVTTTRDAQFIIRAADYKPAGIPSEPLIGDRITRVVTGEVYEVARAGDGGDCHSFYGGTLYAYRVQAGKVGS